MYKDEIKPDRGLLLLHCQDGWRLCRLFKFNMCYTDDAFECYELNTRVYDEAHVPEELMTTLQELPVDNTSTTVDLFWEE